MRPVRGGADPNTDRWLFIALACALALAFALAAVLYSEHRASRDALAKAKRLETAYAYFGLPKPHDTTTIARVLGTDGGAVCREPNSALVKADLAMMLTNGAGGPGLRPIIVDPKTLKGEAIILGIYCPSELPGFIIQEHGLKLERTIEG